MNRKATLLGLLLGLCYLSYAQLPFGVKAGFTQSKINESPQSDPLKISLKSGYQVGVFADFILLKNLKLQPALQLTQKGFKAVEGTPEAAFYWYRNWSLTYLELPVDIVYTLRFSKTFNLHAGAGPVVGFGVFGNGKGTIKYNVGQLYTQEFTVTHPFNKSGIKRMDLGANFLTGIQFKKIMLTASYTHGLTNVLRSDPDFQFSKNRSYTISVGYYLSK